MEGAVNPADIWVDAFQQEERANMKNLNEPVSDLICPPGEGGREYTTEHKGD